MKPRYTDLADTRKTRGSVLLYSVILLVIAGTAIWSVSVMVNSNIRQVQATESRISALYAAEAGPERVSDWFTRAYFAWLKTKVQDGTYETVKDINTLHTWENSVFSNPTFQSYFTPFPNGHFVNAAGDSAFGRFSVDGDETELVIDLRDPEDPSRISSTADSVPYAAYLPRLTDRVTSAGVETSRVVYLRIRRAPDGSEKVATVTAVGRSATGALVTVERDLVKSPMPTILSPAALIARSGAASNGQYNVHWGKIWASANLQVPNPITGFPTETLDQWFGVSTEGVLLIRDSLDPTKLNFCDGHAKNGNSTVPIVSTAENYLIPYLEWYLDPANVPVYSDRENLLQHQDLTDLWPDYSYEVVKELFVTGGYPIYTPTADGKLTGPDPVTGVTVTKYFEELFNLANRTGPGVINDPDNIPWSEMPPIYFVDTKDGLPPKADGSNLPTLSCGGNSPFLYGMFFIAGNMNLNGAGSPPTLNSPEMPADENGIHGIGGSIAKCLLAGLFYSYGTINNTGNSEIYGAVYAKKGFQGGGTWDLYYDWRLNDPLRNHVAPPVLRGMWASYAGQPEDMPGEPSSGTETTQTGG